MVELGPKRALAANKKKTMYIIEILLQIINLLITVVMYIIGLVFSPIGVIILALILLGQIF